MNKHQIEQTSVSRILTSEGAAELLASGWRGADLHVHTLHSYDVIPTKLVDPLALYERARQLGMAHVVFTDHDTMAAYDEIGWTREGLVPAVEVKILDPRRVGHTVHINVYELDRRQFREIRAIARAAQDIEMLAGYLRSERLPFIFNHPFWHEPGENLSVRAVVEIAELFPVLEYNMGRIGRLNAQALRLADMKAKGVAAGTDSHIGDIARAFTLARGATFREFFAEVASRQAYLSPADLNLPRLKEETAVRIRNLFDKRGWLRAKEALTIDTGNALLDGIVRRVARGSTRRSGLARWILRKTIETLSSSGIPGSFYLRSQRVMAERIGRLMESLETAG